jgi:hypothetical protein
VLGNNFISFAGLPPVWAWQITWWLIGFVMMWGLAFKAGLSRPDSLLGAGILLIIGWLVVLGSLL